jgi:hypothetical protein
MAVIAGALGLWSLTSIAGDGRCDRCGCCCQCQAVCRVVCEMKEVSQTTWCCKCEEVCVPGRSQRCDCDCSCGHCPQCREQSWVPTAAYVKSRKVPVKHVEKVKKPSYRLVVEHICPHCAQAPTK